MSEMSEQEFEEIVLECLDYPLQLSFAPNKAERKEQKALGKSLCMSFSNAKYDRKVDVDYFYCNDANKKFVGVRIASISPPKFEKYDITSTGSMKVTMPKLETLAGSDKERLKHSLKVANDNLREHSKVLKGKKFVSDQIDWGGAK